MSARVSVLCAVLTVLGAGAAHADAPALEPPEGAEPIAPIEFARSPIRSATVEEGCAIGVLSLLARAQLPERSDEAGQLGFFVRCRLVPGLQVRFTMPFVLSRWHSNFESTDHSEWGSPALELRGQVLRIRGVRLAAYLAGAVNWQQRSSVVGQLEFTGIVTPGFAASTIYRGIGVHANAEMDVPFGARNARRTFLIGAGLAWRVRGEVTLHLGYQNAIDLLEDSYWADARAFFGGARLRVSRGWISEIGLRYAVNPEAELAFNSLGSTASVINFVYQP